VLFAYKFASGLDTSRAGTRRMIFFFVSFSFYRFTSAHCPSLKKETFYQEGRCMLRRRFEPGIWWV
jgi:hypothetical protein